MELNSSHFLYAESCTETDLHARLPAVSNDGASIRRVAGFDPAEEVEEGGGILWHPVVGPGCKLELTHLSPLTVPVLKGNMRRKKNSIY